MGAKPPPAPPPCRWIFENWAGRMLCLNPKCRGLECCEFLSIKGRRLCKLRESL